MTWQNRIIDFLGLKRSIVALLAMVILVGLGERLAERFLPIYLLALGGGVLSIGLLNGMQNLLSALYSFPGGYLSDRLGYKKALIVFNLIAMFGYLIVILFPYWQAVIIGSLFFMSWSAISLPATMSLVSGVLPENKRTMGVTMHSLVRRIPMALGPIIGGVLIELYGERDGVRMAFAGALLLGLISLFFQQVMIEDDVPRNKAATTPSRLWRSMAPALKQLLASDILIVSVAAFAGAFLWQVSPELNLLTATACGLIGTIYFWIFGKDLKG